MNERQSENRTAKIDISVIIVNWNTKELLRNCLNSVYKTVRGLSLEIIVVDNASSDGSIEMLEKEFPSVIRVLNKENKGFGAANNQALAIMKGEYALLLNSDALLTEEAVKKMWTFCKANEKAGIVCGQLLNADGSKQNSIASFPSLISLAVNNSLLEYLLPSVYPSKRYEHTAPVEVDSAIGACMMIRGEALKETGFFDERYFFFFEETDLAKTMKCHGWKIYHLSDAFIYHLQGQSIGHSASSRIEFYKSRRQFLKKWHSPAFVRFAETIVVMRLLINYLSNLVFVLLTLGINKKANSKLSSYAELIRWHLDEGRKKDS